MFFFPQVSVKFEINHF